MYQSKIEENSYLKHSVDELSLGKPLNSIGEIMERSIDNLTMNFKKLVC